MYQAKAEGWELIPLTIIVIQLSLFIDRQPSGSIGSSRMGGPISVLWGLPLHMWSIHNFISCAQYSRRLIYHTCNQSQSSSYLWLCCSCFAFISFIFSLRPTHSTACTPPGLLKRVALQTPWVDYSIRWWSVMQSGTPFGLILMWNCESNGPEYVLIGPFDHPLLPLI